MLQEHRGYAGLVVSLVRAELENVAPKAEVHLHSGAFTVQG
jgi:hypothetical protein